MKSIAYKLLLKEFCENHKVKALLELAMLDDAKERDEFFMREGKQPDMRNVVSKLLRDLNIEYQEKMKAKADKEAKE